MARSMDFDDIDNSSAFRLMILTKTTAVPALARRAAVRLYEIGKKKYAINFLIKQMNLYKLSSEYKNINGEVCPRAAMELGRLKDERAIEPLFDALGELGFGPAYGLAQIGGITIEKRTIELARGDDKTAIFAAIALGYMKNQQIISRLIYLLTHHQEYEKVINDRISSLRRRLILSLGSYSNQPIAEQYFLSNVTEGDINWILFFYIDQEESPKQRWLEWEIVRKYNWNVYLDSDENVFSIRHLPIDRWKKYYSTNCPFKTEADTETARQQIIGKILNGLKRYNT